MGEIETEGEKGKKPGEKGAGPRMSDCAIV